MSEAKKELEAKGGSLRGKLIEAIEIDRERSNENSSLHIKLQSEMSKPLNGALRKEAASRERIGKLKAPAGLLGDTSLLSHH